MPAVAFDADRDVRIPLDAGLEELSRRHEGVVFSGQVYDVSSFAKNHPGGLEILLKSVGKDMSKVFEAKHSQLTKVFALNFRVGTLVAAERSKSPSPGLRPRENPALQA